MKIINAHHMPSTLPILYLLRLARCNVVSPAQAPLALGLITIFGFAEMRARYRDGSQPHRVLRSSSIPPKSRYARAQDSTYRPCPATRSATAVALGHMTWVSVVLRRRTAENSVAVAAADTPSFTTTKPSSRFVHRAARTDFWYRPGLRSGYRRWRDNVARRSGARRCLFFSSTVTARIP
ncbi:hypothetical protein KCP78_03375 [Salmonella enterica subsp. enterica]|nr:hypothetical protein KCP78_03375 [Salmonella enterica subsp. enterica]